MTHPVFAAGRKALITGAAKGIGRAVAERLAAFDMHVVMVDLANERPPDIAGAVFDPVDVADPAAMQDLAARTGPVDFLMNNAVTRTGRGIDASLDEWHRAVDVNFWGVVNGVRAFLPAMTDAGSGVIVNVGSKQGITNPPGHPIYNAMKAALKSYTESLEHELRADGRISSHLLIPGWTQEDTSDRNPGSWTSDEVAAFMIEGIGRGDFYLLCPDNDVTTEMDHRRIHWGAGDVTENRPPLSRWHPDWRDRAAKACS